MTSATRLLDTSLGSLLTGDNRAYLEDLRRRFENNPDSVDPSWHLALALLTEDWSAAAPTQSRNSESVARLRTRGHTVAALDPLTTTPSPRQAHDAAGKLLGAPIDAETSRLAEIYCAGIGIETEHLDDEQLRQWVYDVAESYRVEDADWTAFARTIVEATEFERLMAIKFTAKKRFGGEGAEAIVLLLRRILWRLATQGVEKAVIGTMHRGRLNLQANAIGRPLVEILADFAGRHPFGDHSAADVPYHLGWQGPLVFQDGRHIEIDLLPNPSHLEAVNTVAIGKTRGLQDAADAPMSVAAIVLHTDASVIAQGSVSEMLQLSGVEGFTTAGTVHVIINNQIGFTTDPEEGRTSKHCTGAWKAIDSLILHVNGEDVPSVVKAADLAADFRTTHRRDSVVDFVCYRRNGHNEIDEPRFTQPLLYDRIEQHPPLADQLAQKLANAISLADTATWRRDYAGRFQPAYDEAKRAAKASERRPPAHANANGSAAPAPATGIDAATLARLLDNLSTPPAELAIEPKIERIVRRRTDAASEGVSWPLAEALAFASLDAEGITTRLTGQDVVRGAFSHRHLGLTDVDTGKRVLQIGHRGGNRRNFNAYNSPLSEHAVLGFEYGYSLARPDALVIWEAQFGDFANGAQIIIDQFVAAGREKWQLESALVLSLPHGLEGQGPEHSSARIERFLQLSQPDNFDVVLPSTPASYFHLLRRQALRTDRKPLVLLAAKAMLRHPAAISPLADFAMPSSFKPVITRWPQNGVIPDRVVFCSGKIAYDVEHEAASRGSERTAVVRIEQLHPFPHTALLSLLRPWHEAHFPWLQEEPANAGARDYILPRLTETLTVAGAPSPNVVCVCRAASGSPAGSFHGWHDQDQAELVSRALR